MRKIYLDMDGVLADFDGQSNALNRFIKEEGFFQKLAPLPLVVKINAILDKPNLRSMIHILSASPNVGADDDKMIWLNKHMPNLITENIHIIRGGQGADERKAKFADADSILFDDYSNNLITWESNGGVGVKIVKEGKSKGIKWKGSRLIVE